MRINYQSIGSGGGSLQVLSRTVDFGATDVPMTDAELAGATGTIEHLPTALGAVALTYNLPAVNRPLHLSARVIAGIFLGHIKRWNDPELKALNPDVPLPPRFLLVHRADGSGTLLLRITSPAQREWASGPGRARTCAGPGHWRQST